MSWPAIAPYDDQPGEDQRDIRSAKRRHPRPPAVCRIACVSDAAYVSRPIEVSEPLDFSLNQKRVLPFDHLNGYSSGVALVNQETFQYISVFVSLF